MIPPQAAQVVVAPTSSAPVIVAWTATVFTFGYTLPWAIAATKRKRNTTSIAVNNVLFGWTIIGWYISLMQAFKNDAVLIVAAPMPQVVVMNNVTTNVGAPPVAPAGPAAGWYPAPNSAPGQQFWDGAAWTEHRQTPDAAPTGTPA